MAEEENIGFSLELHVDLDKAEKSLDSALGRLRQKAKGGIDLSISEKTTDSINKLTTSLNNLSKVNLSKTTAELSNIKSAIDGINKSVVIDVALSKNSASALDSIYKKLGQVKQHSSDFNQAMNNMADNTTKQINRQAEAMDKLMNKMAAMAAENERLGKKAASMGQSPIASTGPSFSHGKGSIDGDVRAVESALNGLQGVLSKNALSLVKHIEVFRDKMGDFGKFDVATGKISLNIEKGVKNLSKTLIHEITHSYATALPNEKDFIAELNKLSSSDKSLRALKQQIKAKYKITDPNELMHELFAHVVEGKFMGKQYNIGEKARKFLQSHFDELFAAENRVFASKGLNQGGDGKRNLEALKAERDAQLRTKANLESKIADAEAKFLARGGIGFTIHQRKVQQLNNAYLDIQKRIARLDNTIAAQEAVGAKPLPTRYVQSTKQLKAGEVAEIMGTTIDPAGSDEPEKKKRGRTPRAERIAGTDNAFQALGKTIDTVSGKFDNFIKKVGDLASSLGSRKAEIQGLANDLRELGNAVNTVKGNTKINIRLSGVVGNAIGDAASAAAGQGTGASISVLPTERQQSLARGAAILAGANQMDKKLGTESVVASGNAITDAHGNILKEIVVKYKGQYNRLLTTLNRQTKQLEVELISSSKDIRRAADNLKINESGLKEMDPRLAELLADKASYIARTAEGLGKVQRIIATRVNGQLKYALHTMEQGKKSTTQVFDDQFGAIAAMDPALQNHGERVITSGAARDRRDAAFSEADKAISNAEKIAKSGGKKEIEETTAAISAEIKKIKELGDTSIEASKKLKELETAHERLGKAAHLNDRAFRAQAFMEDLEAEKTRLGTSGKRGTLNQSPIESIARDSDTNRLVKTVTDVHRVGDNYIQTTQKMIQAEDGSWRVIDLTTKALKNKADALKSVTSLTGKHNRSILDMVETAGKVIVSYGLISQSMRLVKSSIAGIVGEAVKLERSQYDIIKILDESEAQFSTLALKQEATNVLLEKSIEISRVFGVSTEEVMAVQRDFIALYKDTNDAINATVSANKLAVATNIPLADSTKKVVAVASQFGLTAKGVDDFVDSLNEITNKLPTVDAGKLVENIQRMGSVAASSGVSLDRMLTLTAIGMQKSGESAAQTGNALKGFFSDLKSPEKRNYLSEYLGLDKKELIKKDANEIMDLLQKRGAEIESEARKLESTGSKEDIQKAKDLRAQTDTFAARFSGKNQFARIYSTIMTSGAQQNELYDSDEKRVRNAVGSSEREAVIQLESTKKKFDIFLASMRAFGARFGTMVLPYIKSVLDQMTGFFIELDKNRDQIQKNIIGFAQAIKPAVEFLRGAFEGVNATLRITIEAFSNIIGMVNALSVAAGKLGSIFGGGEEAKSSTDSDALRSTGRTLGIVGAVTAATSFGKKFISEKIDSGNPAADSAALVRESAVDFRSEVRAAAAEFRAGVLPNGINGMGSGVGSGSGQGARRYTTGSGPVGLKNPQQAMQAVHVAQMAKTTQAITNSASTAQKTALTNFGRTVNSEAGKVRFGGIKEMFSKLGTSLSGAVAPGTRLGGVLGGLKSVALSLISPVNLAAAGMTLLTDRIIQLNDNLQRGNDAYNDGQAYLSTTVTGKNGKTKALKGRYAQDLDQMLADRAEVENVIKTLEEKESKGQLQAGSSEQKQLNEYRDLRSSLKQRYGDDVDTKLKEYESAVKEYNDAFKAVNEVNNRKGERKTLDQLTEQEKIARERSIARGTGEPIFYNTASIGDKEAANKRLADAKDKADAARRAVEGDATQIRNVMVPYSNMNPRNNNSNGSNLGGNDDPESGSKKALKGASNYLDVARNRFDLIKDRVGAGEISTLRGETDLRGAFSENMQKEIQLAKQKVAEARKLAKTNEEIAEVKEFEQNIEKLIISQSREILEIRSKQRDEAIQLKEAQLSINRAISQSGKTALESAQDSIRFGQEELAIGREKIDNILKETDDAKNLGLSKERTKAIESIQNKLNQERLSLIQKANDLISAQNELIGKQFELATKTASVFSDMSNSGAAKAGIDLVSAQLEAMEVKTRIQAGLLVGEEKTNEEIRTRIKLLEAEANYVKAIRDQGVKRSNVGLEYAGEFGSSLSQQRQLASDLGDAQRRAGNSGRLLSEVRANHPGYAGLSAEQLGEESVSLQNQYSERLKELAGQNPNLSLKIEEHKRALANSSDKAGKPEDVIRREAEEAKRLGSELEKAAQEMAKKDTTLASIIEKQTIVSKLASLTTQNIEDQINLETTILAIKKNSVDIEKQAYDLENKKLQLEASRIDLEQTRSERYGDSNIVTRSIFDNQRKANVEKQEINNLNKNKVDQGFISDLISMERGKGSNANLDNIKAWENQLSSLKLEEEEIKIKITANRESLDSLSSELRKISEDFGNNFRNAFSSAIAATLSGPNAKKIEELSNKLKDISEKNRDLQDRLADLDQQEMDMIAPPSEEMQRMRQFDKISKDRENIYRNIAKNNEEGSKTQQEIDNEKNPFARFNKAFGESFKDNQQKSTEGLFNLVGEFSSVALTNPGAIGEYANTIGQDLFKVSVSDFSKTTTDLKTIVTKDMKSVLDEFSEKTEDKLTEGTAPLAEASLTFKNNVDIFAQAVSIFSSKASGEELGLDGFSVSNGTKLGSIKSPDSESSPLVGMWGEGAGKLDQNNLPPELKPHVPGTAPQARNEVADTQNVDNPGGEKAKPESVAKDMNVVVEGADMASSVGKIVGNASGMIGGMAGTAAANSIRGTEDATEAGNTGASMGSSIGGSIGSMVGTAGTAALTPILGPLAPVLGPMIGGAAGSLLGGLIGGGIGDMFGAGEKAEKERLRKEAEAAENRRLEEERKRRQEMMELLEEQARYAQIQAAWQKTAAENAKVNARIIQATGETFKSAGEVISQDLSIFSASAFLSGRGFDPITAKQVGEGTPSFDGGGLLPNTSKYDGISAILHKGEMILPQDITQGLISMIRGGMTARDASSISNSFVPESRPASINLQQSIERAFNELALPELRARVIADVQMPESLPVMAVDVDARINMPEIPTQSVDIQANFNTHPEQKPGSGNTGMGYNDINQQFHIDRTRGRGKN